MKKTLLFIIGSLREKSFNRQLARRAGEFVAGRADISFLDYADLPFMNQDAEFPVPPAVERVRKAALAADEDRRIIISYQEFYEIVRRYCTEYANQHLEEKEEIMHLLERLRKRLDSASTTDLKVYHRRT